MLKLGTNPIICEEGHNWTCSFVDNEMERARWRCKECGKVVMK